MALGLLGIGIVALLVLLFVVSPSVLSAVRESRERRAAVTNERRRREAAEDEAARLRSLLVRAKGRVELFCDSQPDDPDAQKILRPLLEEIREETEHENKPLE